MTKVIAVVDDEADVRVSTRDLLRSYGAQVLAFDAAESFLASPEAARIDCLVTDFRMPGMNGAALLDALRQRGATFPVVVISALDSGATQAFVMSKGAAAFLRKPVDPDELVATLEHLNCLGGPR